MDQNARARATEPEKQTAMTRHLAEPSYGHGRGDWPDPLGQPRGLTEDEFGMLQSQVAGHRWNAWRRLTGDEDYFATCSCGWRSTDVGYVSPMLQQVRNHLDAVWAVRGWRPVPLTTQESACDDRGRAASQHDIRPDERARELYASVENQQRRLCQVLEHSTDLLSASEDQADRFVAALEYTAARVAPEWAKTKDSAQRAEAVQHQVERAKELRNRIVAAAEALAVVAEEVLLVNQGLEPAILAAPPGISTYSANPANRHARP